MATPAVLGLVLSGVVLSAVVLSGCGTQEHGGSAQQRALLKPLPLITASELTHTAPARVGHGALPAVGVSQQVTSRGAHLTVTVREVIDPLRGGGIALPAGMRAVGILVQIRNAGPGLYDSSATGDFDVVASGGYVTPVLVKRGVCKTPLEDFDRYITAGEDRVGCVAFTVADGAILDAVTFSPHAQARGRLSWAP